MKTKEYIKKYDLNINDKFDHSDFIADITIDFITLLEVGKATKNIKGFENAVRAIRMKWDAISNKTLGILPEKLWKYFYASVIVKMREELFPDEMKWRRDEKAERKKRYDDWKAFEQQEEDMWSQFFFRSILSDLFKKRIPTDSFNLLNIDSSSNEDDIKNAYRKLAKVNHPDLGGDKNKFIEITEAKNKCLAYVSK